MTWCIIHFCYYILSHVSTYYHIVIYYVVIDIHQFVNTFDWLLIWSSIRSWQNSKEMHKIISLHSFLKMTMSNNHKKLRTWKCDEIAFFCTVNYIFEENLLILCLERTRRLIREKVHAKHFGCFWGTFGRLKTLRRLFKIGYKP